MKDKILTLIPIVLYASLMILILFYNSYKSKNKGEYIKEYYLGSRSLNGFVLSMTLVATYIGASSFISGPSIVNKNGLSWVLLASIQIPVVMLTLGILGKKIAIVSRKINAITIIDILKSRYKSKYLILLISISTLIFLVTSSIAQFIGGAKLLQTMLDIPYIYSLTIFFLIVVIYTSFGGFKVIAMTDTIQSFIMVLAIIVIFITLYVKQGGMSNITNMVKNIDIKYLTPTSNNSQSFNYTFSFFLLVGIGVLGLPSTVVRTMAFKSTKSLHNSIIIGSLILGFIIIGMHLIGYMSIPIVPKSNLGDSLVPFIATKYLHPFLTGIFIGGPLFAIMSSVDSILIIISSIIVKDIYIETIVKNNKIEDIKIKKISKMVTVLVGILVYILSIKPFSLIVYINLFALTGQELIFLLPLMFALFSKKATSLGAFSAIISGVLSMFLINIFKINFYDTHYIVPSILVSLIFYFIFNRFGKETELL